MIKANQHQSHSPFYNLYEYTDNNWCFVKIDQYIRLVTRTDPVSKTE